MKCSFPPASLLRSSRQHLTGIPKLEAQIPY